MWETEENTGFRFENLTESSFKAAIHQRIFSVFSYHLFLDPFLLGFSLYSFHTFFCFIIYSSSTYFHVNTCVLAKR